MVTSTPQIAPSTFTDVRQMIGHGPGPLRPPNHGGKPKVTPKPPAISQTRVAEAIDPLWFRTQESRPKVYPQPHQKDILPLVAQARNVATSSPSAKTAKVLPYAQVPVTNSACQKPSDAFTTHPRLNGPTYGTLCSAGHRSKLLVCLFVGRSAEPAVVFCSL